MKRQSRFKLLLIIVMALVAVAAFVKRAPIHRVAIVTATQANTASPPPQTASNASSTASSSPSSPSAPPAPSVPTAAQIGHVVGVAEGGGLSKISTSTLNAELDQMVTLGVKWVRFDIEWGDVQYSSNDPSKSTWGAYDTLVNAIDAHHLNALGVITFTPMWARAPGCTGGVECPPADPSTFATFAAEVAARYKGDGLHYWEIWNEPNNFNFWATKVDCNAYAALLKVTYPAIKAADPNAIVVTGGLAPESTNNVSMSPTDFLSCIYNAGAKNYFDAVGDHPYTFPTDPAADTGGAWAQMSKTSPSLRSIMITNGDSNKKIWLTEFGIPTNGPDPNWFVSESTQAMQVTDAMNLYKSYSWAGPIFWYTFQDASLTDTSTNENFFGLVRADGSTKPAFTTLQNIIKAGL
jgi:hypothetical protein